VRWITLTSLFPNGAFPSRGVFVRERLRAVLAASEGEASVVAPVPWFPFRRGFGEWSRAARVPRLEREGSLLVHHPRYPLLPRLSEPVHPLLFEAGCAATVRRLRDGAGLLDAHYLYPDGVAAGRLARRLRLPFVLTARGSDVNVLARRRIPRAWIRAAVRAAAAVVAVSESLRRALAEATGRPTERIEVIPNGVDTERFRPGHRALAKAQLGLPADREILLAVGRLVEGKRYDLAVRALAFVRREPPPLLLLVGDGPERARIEGIARENGLDGRVRFAGERPPEEMPLYYQAADLFLHPSTREGHPNVVLEALACAVPVVASGAGGIPETVGSEGGAIVEGDDPRAFARSIERVLASPPPPDAVRGRALTYSWPVVGERVAEVFRRVLRSP
jgi:glycosyltransferase involved in cell wall biosynthesis